MSQIATRKIGSPIAVLAIPSASSASREVERQLNREPQREDPDPDPARPRVEAHPLGVLAPAPSLAQDAAPGAPRAAASGSDRDQVRGRRRPRSAAAPGRKKSSALPVRSAMNADSATPAKPASANCSGSRRDEPDHGDQRPDADRDPRPRSARSLPPTRVGDHEGERRQARVGDPLRAAERLEQVGALAWRLAVGLDQLDPCGSSAAASADRDRSGRRAKLHVRVVLERLGDRPLGLAQGPRRRPPAPAPAGCPSASTMNPCASGESAKPPRSQAAQTTPPAAPEKPDQLVGLAAARARARARARSPSPAPASAGRRARSTAPPRRRRRRRRRPTRSRRGSPGSGRAGCRRPGSAPRSRSRRSTASQARAAAPSAAPSARRFGCAATVCGGGHRRQVAAALVQDQVEAEERLQPAAEARARPAHALGDRPDPPPRRRCRGAGSDRPRRSGCCAGRPPRS